MLDLLIFASNTMTLVVIFIYYRVWSAKYFKFLALTILAHRIQHEQYNANNNNYCSAASSQDFSD